MTALLDSLQPFLDLLNDTMKQAFIEQHGQALFDHKYPSGRSMKLVWLTDDLELRVSKTLLYLFMHDIESGKNARSWLCIRVHKEQIQFHMKSAQSVMESIATIAGNNLDTKQEALNICTTFDEHISIPVMFILDTPQHKHVTMELFAIPWSNYTGPVRIPSLPPLYAKVHREPV